MDDPAIVPSPRSPRTKKSPTGGVRRAQVLVGGVVIALLLLAIDAAIFHFFRGIRPGGDARRELELLQQFGSPTTIGLAALAIWRLDPRRLRRVLDWLAALGMTASAIFILKMAIGRARPKFRDPFDFLGPWGARVVKEGDPPRHAWQFWHDDVTEIWSMPSSHTAMAVVAAVFLGRMYPRLMPVAAALAALVGCCRVLFGAHYASDVVVGAVLGYVVTTLVYERGVGVRTIDWLWRAFIDRDATPAWPRVRDIQTPM